MKCTISCVSGRCRHKNVRYKHCALQKVAGDIHIYTRSHFGPVFIALGDLSFAAMNRGMLLSALHSLPSGPQEAEADEEETEENYIYIYIYIYTHVYTCFIRIEWEPR